MAKMQQCALCGARAKYLGGYASDEQGEVYLCHNDKRSCYTEWTVFRVRPDKEAAHG